MIDTYMHTWLRYIDIRLIKADFDRGITFLDTSVLDDQIKKEESAYKEESQSSFEKSLKAIWTTLAEAPSSLNSLT